MHKFKLVHEQGFQDILKEINHNRLVDHMRDLYLRARAKEILLKECKKWDLLSFL